MRTSRLGFALVLLALAACTRNQDRTTFYATSPAAGSSFPTMLASLARRHGLHAEVIQTGGGAGPAIFTIKAHSFRRKVWSRNMPIDAKASCDRLAGAMIDPRYFIVEVGPTVTIFGRRDTHRLAKDLAYQLGAAGYPVQWSPALCGSFAPAVAGR